VGAQAFANQENDWGFFWDYSAGHYPLKTLNERLSFVLCRLKGGKPTKAPGTIKSCPFNVLKPPKGGWP